MSEQEKIELKEGIRDILRGIDKHEEIDADAYWETPDGAEFGARRLRLIDELIDKL